jgi:hypothetical protein
MGLESGIRDDWWRAAIEDRVRLCATGVRVDEHQTKSSPSSHSVTPHLTIITLISPQIRCIPSFAMATYTKTWRNSVWLVWSFLQLPLILRKPSASRYRIVH